MSVKRVYVWKLDSWHQSYHYLMLMLSHMCGVMAKQDVILRHLCQLARVMRSYRDLKVHC